MNSSDNVRDRFAVQQLALPPHAKSLRQVTTCPFCNHDHRRIAIDTAAVYSARVCYPNGPTFQIHDYPDQRLFAFGGDALWRQPCPHLALMWGSCCWLDAPNADLPSVEFDYDSPACRAQPNSDLEIFLQERVLPRACDKRFLPTTPVHERRICKQLRTRANREEPAMTFELNATIYFALDPETLFDELARKSEEFDRWFAALTEAANH
ncbi:MAG: hypothetical protein NTY19_09080 [Planctomycetota bacterium]|nr:hypothetical protein [Planctomycetota bacterium]